MSHLYPTLLANVVKWHLIVHRDPAIHARTWMQPPAMQAPSASLGASAQMGPLTVISTWIIASKKLLLLDAQQNYNTANPRAGSLLYPSLFKLSEQSSHCKLQSPAMFVSWLLYFCANQDYAFVLGRCTIDIAVCNSGMDTCCGMNSTACSNTAGCITQGNCQVRILWCLTAVY